jgi:hypothetical protein
MGLSLFALLLCWGLAQDHVDYVFGDERELPDWRLALPGYAGDNGGVALREAMERAGCVISAKLGATDGRGLMAISAIEVG